MLLKNTLHVLHSVCVVLFVSGEIERLGKNWSSLYPSSCWLSSKPFALETGWKRFTTCARIKTWLLRTMDWWAPGWWCDQVHNPRGKIFISGYVLFPRGDRYFSDLSSFEIVKSILELGISNTLTFISWKKWWSHGNKVPVLKHECLHQMLRLTDTYGSWYR